MSMNDLDGKVCLVTGASRGIGRATALALAERGAAVAVNYLNSPEQAEEVCSAIKARGGRCLKVRADIADVEEARRMLEEIKAALGPVTVLVNNAGITRDKSFLKMTRVMWDEVLGVNLNGPFNITQEVLPGMVENGWGRIINLASIVGLTGNFGQANYAVTKGGIIAFTMTLAREVARKGITVNAIAPGYIETDMTKDVSAAVLDQVKAMTPMGRLGKPEEVADTIAFLASPRASYITGQVLSVNGGMYM
jgi:3-oxoacyl-(acyl-carrier-protein) reductase